MKLKMAFVIMISSIVPMLLGCGAVINQGVNFSQNHNEMMQIKHSKIIISNKNEGVGYEVVKKVWENKDNNVIICYPQVSGYKGILLMDYMNQTLRKITEPYGYGETYRDVSIDYKITKMDSNTLSVLYEGTAQISGGKEINIMQSVNLDIITSNLINISNLVQANQASETYIKTIINQKAEFMGLKQCTDFLGLRFYFEGENIVFFFMPADDSEKDFVEVSIPKKELEIYINSSFGERPAS